jgi:pyruvate,water dikinase
VFWLDRAPDRPQLGGKGRTLARLKAAGLPVPPGFVLCADALPAEQPAALPAPPTLPDAAAAALASAYAELGRRLGEPEPLVAVRSSGLAEDLAQASFAGQYATVLGVHGAADVLAAAARCWASLWSPGVVTYRAAIEQRTGVALPAPGMAVVVQALVPATVAGVADTVDVTSGARDVVTISASWGLGRTVVDGAVQPDCWRVLRDGLHVLELRIGDKATRGARSGRGAGAGARGDAPQAVPDDGAGR